MSLERYKRANGLVSYAYKFQYLGKCYRGPLGVVSEAVARRMELQAKARVHAGDIKPVEMPTLNEFAPQFLSYVRENVRKRTSQAYEHRLVAHILPLLGTRRLSDVTTTCLKRYQQKRAEEGAAPGTINGELAILSALLHYSANLGILPDTACGKIPWTRVPKQPSRILTIVEEAQLIAAATPHLKPLIRFALQTGLFRQELLRLTWNDIHWDRPSIVISDDIASHHKRREIPLTREAMEVLRELHGNHDPHDRVFGYRWINQLFCQAANKAGLPGVNCNNLRETFAHRCLAAGINIRLVQKWLGHGSLSLTEHYVNVEGHNERKSIELLHPRTRPQTKRHPVGDQMSLALEL